jgi:hypothetical protein
MLMVERKELYDSALHCRLYSLRAWAEAVCYRIGLNESTKVDNAGRKQRLLGRDFFLNVEV